MFIRSMFYVLYNASTVPFYRLKTMKSSLNYLASVGQYCSPLTKFEGSVWA